jgi:phosphoenolpyruvate synthase/pyruvate phosphate dikinase
MLELEMADACYDYLTKYDEYTNIVREVPFLSRCIDLVLISSSGEIISIEFKIKNWRHAIEQAKNHMLGADKAYICLPEKNLSTALLDALEDSAIGLYLYSPDKPDIMIEAVPAPRNNHKVTAFQTMLKNTVEKIALSPLVHSC